MINSIGLTSQSCLGATPNYISTSSSYAVQPGVTSVIVKNTTKPVTIGLPKLVPGVPQTLTIGNFGSYDFYLQPSIGDSISGCPVAQSAVRMLTLTSSPTVAYTWQIAGTCSNLASDAIVNYYRIPSNPYAIQNEEILTVPSNPSSTTVTFPANTKWLLTKLS